MLKHTRFGSKEIDVKLDNVAPWINLSSPFATTSWGWPTLSEEGGGVGGSKAVTSATGCADSRISDRI